MTSKEENGLSAEVSEALKEFKFLLPVYKAILKRTKDKKQAMDAIRFLVRIRRSNHLQPKDWKAA